MAKLIRLVIDTNSYAGNFERELCAYVTGQYGECGVGKDYAEYFSPQIAHLDWWDSHIVSRSEYRHESPCKRPATIYWNDKTGSYNSVAIYVKKIPTENIMIEFAERIKEFCNNRALLKAQLHNETIKDPNQLFLLKMMGLESKAIDLSTVGNTADMITVDGIRIFEGIKNEVLVGDMPFHGQFS